MIKRVLYGAEARAKVVDGVRKIAAAVKVTLGPLGRNVLISPAKFTQDGLKHLPVHTTKDGYTVASAFDVEDPFEKSGVMYVKECAQKTVDQAGDGTTTTVVLMEAIVKAGIKLVDAGVNPIQLKREIDEAVAYIVGRLKKMAVQIDTNERIFNIATISANNDPHIGRLIADAFQKIGKDGIIDIEASQAINTEIKIAEGYRFGKSWVSPYFINNPEKQICEYENPLILLFEKQIIHHTQIIRACEIAANEGRPLVIICEDAREEGLGFLLANNANKRISCVVVHAPNFGDQRRQEMEDIAILTSGTYISDSKGQVDLKEIELPNFGKAKKVIVTKDETIIIGGESDKEDLARLLNQLRENIKQTKTEEEAYPIEGRIAKLQGGVAVIQVGATTESEMKERLDRFDDAVRATKSAIAEGYVPGAGRMFHVIASSMHRETQGSALMAEALMTPFIQICLNAGIDYLHVWEEGSATTCGYNAKSGKWEDLIEAGVIDPVKVLRCALQNAASSASMVLTTECLISDVG